MTRIIGPNGIPFDVDGVVASGLLGSASGEYKLAGAEPETEATDSSPDGIRPADTPEKEAPEDGDLPEGQVPPAEDYDPADKTLEEKDFREVTPDGTTSSRDEAPEKPAGNASHEAWVDYALAVGKSPDELDGLNRNAVRDLFKE